MNTQRAYDDNEDHPRSPSQTPSPSFSTLSYDTPDPSHFELLEPNHPDSCIYHEPKSYHLSLPVKNMHSYEIQQSLGIDRNNSLLLTQEYNISAAEAPLNCSTPMPLTMYTPHDGVHSRGYQEPNEPMLTQRGLGMVVPYDIGLRDVPLVNNEKHPFSGQHVISEVKGRADGPNTDAIHGYPVQSSLPVFWPHPPLSCPFSRSTAMTSWASPYVPSPSEAYIMSSWLATYDSPIIDSDIIQPSLNNPERDDEVIESHLLPYRLFAHHTIKQSLQSIMR